MTLLLQTGYLFIQLVVVLLHIGHLCCRAVFLSAVVIAPLFHLP